MSSITTLTTDSVACMTKYIGQAISNKGDGIGETDRTLSMLLCGCHVFEGFD